MALNPYNALWQFQKSFGQPHSVIPHLPAEKRRSLRKSLLAEEYQEYLDGEADNDLTAIGDALADMVYIIYGTAVEYGLPLDALFNEVHRSNMTKLDPTTGKPIYRADGKVLKPASYSPPNLAAIIERRKDACENLLSQNIDPTEVLAPETPSVFDQVSDYLPPGVTAEVETKGSPDFCVETLQMLIKAAAQETVARKAAEVEAAKRAEVEAAKRAEAEAQRADALKAAYNPMSILDDFFFAQKDTAPFTGTLPEVEDRFSAVEAEVSNAQDTADDAQTNIDEVSVRVDELAQEIAAAADAVDDRLDGIEDSFIRAVESVSYEETERFAVYVAIGSNTRPDIAQKYVETFKTDFLKDIDAQGDDAIYYFLPTSGKTKIVRL